MQTSLELIQNYLDEGRVMQLATVRGGKPWICTVYFVVDKNLRLYWTSLPTRRHSAELMEDRQAAIAVAIKLDHPVIGVQAEGIVEVVEHAETVRGIMDKYTAKYDTGHDFYDNFVQGTNKHRLYRFTPERFSLFDEVNFAGKSPVEIALSQED